jgi:hypothetical protein
MAKTLDPFYSIALGNFAARATAAKTTFTDATNAVRVKVGGTDWEVPPEGAILNRAQVRCLGAGSIPATACYLFTSSDDGTTLSLKSAATFAAQTVSTAAASATVDLLASFDEPIQLSAGEWVYVAIGVALAAGFQFEGSFEAFGA